jgi:hypothetical protein
VRPTSGGPTKNLKGGQKTFCIFFFIENSLLNNNFIHFQLQYKAPICLQIPSKVKVTLGKIMLFSSCSEIPDVGFFILIFFLRLMRKKWPAHN